jgi:arginase
VRRIGLDRAVERALQRVTSSGLDGFFIHFDADSLDDDIMPAVDYRLPGGFSWDEARSMVARAMATGRAVGLEVTIYNPALDEEESAGRGLTDMLVGALSGYSSTP